eukprot:CAMPEP_0119132042 /NCGR_PEP_ID=MMETSP1310-20130426/11251_1 /TAXON_ID=464262 /ORGANISM="Genus nov. species nov., Strain RCC2339" /LENGTH=185 /DNA_ID=CAMNT_0007122653 /DNA_START=71 /DNA_END=628 /DNA_ORIENTATION=+
MASSIGFTGIPCGTAVLTQQIMLLSIASNLYPNTDVYFPLYETGKQQKLHNSTLLAVKGVSANVCVTYKSSDPYYGNFDTDCAKLCCGSVVVAGGNKGGDADSTGGDTDSTGWDTDSTGWDPNSTGWDPNSTGGSSGSAGGSSSSFRSLCLPMGFAGKGVRPDTITPISVSIEPWNSNYPYQPWK